MSETPFKCIISRAYKSASKFNKERSNYQDYIFPLHPFKRLWYVTTGLHDFGPFWKLQFKSSGGNIGNSACEMALKNALLYNLRNTLLFSI